YHKILNETQSAGAGAPYALARAEFARQMGYLAENGFVAATLDEILAEPGSPRKRVVITFDDGYGDNFTEALPVLLEFSLKATFFVIVNRIGTPDFMTWKQLLALRDAQMDVQSHTLNHRPLTRLSEADLVTELAGSRILLRGRLGKEIEFISFPHGVYNRRVVDACKEAGYLGSCNSRFGYFDPHSDPFAIERFMIKSTYDFNTFVQMVNGQWLFRMKVGIPSQFKQGVARVIGFDTYQRIYRAVHRETLTVS
ncbi:MAG: polysaccharide deacetylase family protein, partial [Calditrichaeota bacterium]